jgi:hypothetical protein
MRLEETSGRRAESARGRLSAWTTAKQTAARSSFGALNQDRAEPSPARRAERPGIRATECTRPSAKKNETPRKSCETSGWMHTAKSGRVQIMGTN